MAKRKSLFDTRLEEHIDELRGLYLDIYHDENSFEYFLSMLRRCFKERKATLRAVDERRKANPMIHHSNKMMGMMMYTEKFAGNLQGVKEKLQIGRAHV